MEHKLIRGGEQYLPFARSRIKALRANGLTYASQQFEIDGVSVKVRVAGEHEYISLEGGRGVVSIFSQTLSAGSSNATAGLFPSSMTSSSYPRLRARDANGRLVSPVTFGDDAVGFITGTSPGTGLNSICGYSPFSNKNIRVGIPPPTFSGGIWTGYFDVFVNETRQDTISYVLNNFVQDDRSTRYSFLTPKTSADTATVMAVSDYAEYQSSRTEEFQFSLDDSDFFTRRSSEVSTGRLDVLMLSAEHVKDDAKDTDGAKALQYRKHSVYSDTEPVFRRVTESRTPVLTAPYPNYAFTWTIISKEESSSTKLTQAVTAPDKSMFVSFDDRSRIFSGTYIYPVNVNPFFSPGIPAASTQESDVKVSKIRVVKKNKSGAMLPFDEFKADSGIAYSVRNMFCGDGKLFVVYTSFSSFNTYGVCEVRLRVYPSTKEAGIAQDFAALTSEPIHDSSIKYGLMSMGGLYFQGVSCCVKNLMWGTRYVYDLSTKTAYPIPSPHGGGLRQPFTADYHKVAANGRSATYYWAAVTPDLMEVLDAGTYSVANYPNYPVTGGMFIKYVLTKDPKTGVVTVKVDTDASPARGQLIPTQTAIWPYGSDTSGTGAVALRFKKP